jgi:type VI secretion system secreted protein VgrG
MLVPFDQLEDEGEHFFNRSHRAVMGKKITFSFSPRLGLRFLRFRISGHCDGDTAAKPERYEQRFVLKGYSPTIVLEDSVQRRSFLRGTVQDIFNTVLQPYPQNLLRKQLILKMEVGRCHLPNTMKAITNF